ncbi:MAG: hypothetical protein CME64_07235 [Halobacteriovoraceae bacterium]|nr:hypothetical protein [Halobacteriovoraceae bacterium]
MNKLFLMSALMAASFVGHASDYSHIRCYENISEQECSAKPLKSKKKMKSTCTAEVTLRHYDGTKSLKVLDSDASVDYKDGLTNIGLFTLGLYDKGRESVAKFKVNSNAENRLERQIEILKKTLNKCQ